MTRTQTRFHGSAKTLFRRRGRIGLIDAEAVLGKADGDLFAPEDAARIIELKRRALDGGAAARADFKMTVGGKTIYYDFQVEPLFDENGTTIGIASAATEIISRIVASTATWDAIFAAEQAAVVGERNRIAR